MNRWSFFNEFVLYSYWFNTRSKKLPWKQTYLYPHPWKRQCFIYFAASPDGCNIRPPCRTIAVWLNVLKPFHAFLKPVFHALKAHTNFPQSARVNRMTWFSRSGFTPSLSRVYLNKHKLRRVRPVCFRWIK